MANKIRWDTEAMETVASKLNRLCNELAACKSTVRNIAARMDQESGGDLYYGRSTRLPMTGMSVGSASIRSCLRQYANALDRYDSVASRLAMNLKSTARDVESSERSMSRMFTETGTASPFDSSYGTGGTPSGSGSAGATTEEPKKATIKWGKLILDVIGKFGYVGSIINGILTFDGSLPAGLKSVVKIGDTIAKWFKDGSWRKIIGMNDFLEHPSTLSGLAQFGENFKNGFVSGMKKTAKWFTSLITYGFSNWEEHGGQPSTRFFAEWAAETIADVTLYAGTAALIGAGFVAAGVSAPALLVGACATVAIAVVDVAWKNLVTGDGETGIVESFGNLIGDAAEFVEDMINGEADPRVLGTGLA